MSLAARRLAKTFDPSQPREPKGSEDGGQWSSPKSAKMVDVESRLGPSEPMRTWTSDSGDQTHRTTSATYTDPKGDRWQIDFFERFDRNDPVQIRATTERGGAQATEVFAWSVDPRGAAAVKSGKWEITLARTGAKYRRRGLATAALALMRRHATMPIVHSNSLTENGRAYAETVKDFDPAQPRAPKGSENGGEWVDAAKARLAELDAQIRRLSARGDLSRAEALHFTALVDEQGNLLADVAKPYNPAKIPPPEARKSTLSVDAVVTARNDLIRNKPIFVAIHQAASGVWFDADTPVDAIVLDQNSAVSAREFYDAFDATRGVLRREFGDSMTLYRATGQQKQKPTTNWATTREFARQFGPHVIQQRVAIDDIAAVNVKGGYHEIIVLDPRYRPVVKDFNPNQPRDPAGTPTGGQWAEGWDGGAAGAAMALMRATAAVAPHLRDEMEVGVTTIDRFEELIASEPIETLGFFDKDGKLLAAKTGNEDSVEWDGPLPDGAVAATHNHPSGTPGFSIDDIAFSAYKGLDSITSVTVRPVFDADSAVTWVRSRYTMSGIREAVRQADGSRAFSLAWQKSVKVAVDNYTPRYHSLLGLVRASGNESLEYVAGRVTQHEQFKYEAELADRLGARMEWRDIGPGTPSAPATQYLRALSLKRTTDRMAKARSGISDREFETINPYTGKPFGTALAKFVDDQPRAPKGSAIGGQWVDTTVPLDGVAAAERKSIGVLHQDSKPHRPLTRAELEALDAYQGGSYNTLNQAARREAGEGTDPSSGDSLARLGHEYAMRPVNTIHALASEAPPLTEPIVVFRGNGRAGAVFGVPWVTEPGGIHVSAIDDDGHDIVDPRTKPYTDAVAAEWKKRVGSIVRENGFLSTSADQKFVKQWVARRRYDGLPSTYYEIALPKGTRGIYMPNFSGSRGFDAEREFLLPPGSRLRVDRVLPPTKTRHGFLVKMTLVGQVHYTPPAPVAPSGGSRFDAVMGSPPLKKYDEGQPRAPKGSPEGGEWTDVGAAANATVRRMLEEGGEGNGSWAIDVTNVPAAFDSGWVAPDGTIVKLHFSVSHGEAAFRAGSSYLDMVKAGAVRMYAGNRFDMESRIPLTRAQWRSVQALYRAHRPNTITTEGPTHQRDNDSVVSEFGGLGLRTFHTALLNAGFLRPDMVSKEYDPDQPRAPKGAKNGGQWIDSGADSDESREEDDAQTTADLKAGAAAESAWMREYAGVEPKGKWQAGGFKPDYPYNDDVHYDFIGGDEYPTGTPAQQATLAAVNAYPFHNSYNSVLRQIGRSGTAESEARGFYRDNLGDKIPTREALMWRDRVMPGFHPLDRDVYVYRGMTSRFDPMRNPKGPGGEFVDYGFVSTSFRYMVAKGHVGQKEGSAVVRIKIPKGTPVLFTGADTQREIVLAPGTRFRMGSSRRAFYGSAREGNLDPMRLYDAEVVR